MQTLDIMDSIKKRLQEQQARLRKSEGKSSQNIYRAELDALWACVEVLAQAIDGQREVIVPDYFSDPKIHIVTKVKLDD